MERRDDFLRKIKGKLLRNIPCHSRKSIEKLINEEFPENTALISFRDEGTMPVDYSAKTDRVFYIELDNIRGTDWGYTSFDQSYVILTDELFPKVRELANFIRKALDENLNIICQCETGFGRSTGCAAAIRNFRYEGDCFGDYYEYVTLSEEVYPNVHVYNRIFNALKKEPCLPNFAHLREQCKSTDYFACQVFLKNNTLELIINDLDKLNAIDMEQVLYFTGGWHDSRGFAQIDTEQLLGLYTYSGSRKELEDINAYEAFSVHILYELVEMGMDVKKVESLIPKLYEFYNTDENLRSNEKRYRDFQEKWQSLIDRWKEWLIEEE